MKTEKGKMRGKHIDPEVNTYLFDIRLVGTGRTPEEAWEDAIEGFMNDPGYCPDKDEYTIAKE